jgi:hypothetical protein
MRAQVGDKRRCGLRPSGTIEGAKKGRAPGFNQGLFLCASDVPTNRITRAHQINVGFSAGFHRKSKIPRAQSFERPDTPASEIIP